MKQRHVRTASVVERPGAGSRRGSGSKPAGGFSYVEVLIGMLIMTVAAGGLFASMLESRSLARVNDESSRAYTAAERMLEEIAGAPFDEIFKIYNATPSDDAGVAAMGPGFAVAGLRPQAGDADGLAGRIEFPQSSGVPPKALHEDTIDASFGMPRDLNADGKVDGADHAGDYRLLPVRVHVEWAGVSGDRAIWVETLLAEG